MSTEYFLTCMKCKTGVNLGKGIRVEYQDVNSKTFGFSSLGGMSNNTWVPSQKDAESLQHFLIMHRTHELRVLPDNVEKYSTDVGFPHSWPDDDRDYDPLYDRLLFLEQNTGEPDPDLELENLSKDVIGKLKQF